MADVPGTYLVQLIVDDGMADSLPDTVAVRAQNTPPVADAGPDQTVANGQTVTLNGSNSTDGDDGIVSYRWVQTSGIALPLTDNQAAQTTFLAPETDLQGISVEFELTVVDANGLSSTDSCIVNVTPQNEPPNADAGGNILAAPGRLVVLDGSSSHDIDDEITAFSWTQIEGSPVILSDPRSPSPDFTTPDVGFEGESFIFRLTVTDQGGLKDTDSCIVNVSWQNQAPSAVVSEYPETTEGRQIELNGLQSSDSDGGIVQYRWRQLEGPPVVFDDPEAPQMVFVAPRSDRYGSNLVFALTVRDGGGLQDSAACSVFVFPENSAPFAGDNAYSMAAETQLTVPAPGILANDIDANGQTLSSLLSSSPVNGSLTLYADGSFVYTPVYNFVGTDYFTYIANDGAIGSNIATVSITVDPSRPTMFVSGITIDLNQKGSNYQSKAHVIVEDDAGNPLKDANVAGRWMLNGSVVNEVSALTNGVGEARLDSDRFKAASTDQLTFVIIDVVKEGCTHDSSSDIVSEADVRIP